MEPTSHSLGEAGRVAPASGREPPVLGPRSRDCLSSGTSKPSALSLQARNPAESSLEDQDAHFMDGNGAETQRAAVQGGPCGASCWRTFGETEAQSRHSGAPSPWRRDRFRTPRVPVDGQGQPSSGGGGREQWPGSRWEEAECLPGPCRDKGMNWPRRCLSRPACSPGTVPI